MDSSNSDNLICTNCIDEDYICKSIEERGVIDNCSYCGEILPTIPLSSVATKVYEVLEKHFYLTNSEPDYFEYKLSNDPDSKYEWYREGERLPELIGSLLNTDDKIADDIQRILSDIYSDPFEMYSEDPFDSEACYEESKADESKALLSWNNFIHEIKTESRYFGRQTTETLDSLFKNVNLYKTFDSKNVVQLLNDKLIYRARVANSHNDLEKILKNPEKELCRPPSNLSKPGRMNSHGVSIFYGSFEVETCISELRPPVGSYVVIGEFKISEELRILDFDMLSKMSEKISYFDPNSCEVFGKSAFIRSIVNELTKPIIPSESEFEYLPTQVISEYLANKVEPRIDGIVFNSSVTSNNGKNIVLFAHASDVEPNLRNKIANINFGWCSDDDFDDTITLFSKCDQSVKKNTASHSFLTSTNEKKLKLNLDQLKVEYIEGVTYETYNRSVQFIRNPDDKDIDDFT